LLAITAWLALSSLTPAQARSRATEFRLDNGMHVVVIPDNRVPVVTHMVWYHAGGADDPPGVGGIAHYLEHLMFKSTARLKSGEFSRIITRLGGNDNAVTTHDATYYFQRVAKDRLKAVMELEADRMHGLNLLAEEVETERDVVKEERRSGIDADPISVLNEQMMAALYQNHPYRRPVIGWPHEIATLTRDDARRFYARFYAPNNAILVVAGDVTVDEVRKLAAETYGRNPARPDVRIAQRPQEPEPLAARRIERIDPRSAAPTVFRFYLTPAIGTALPGEAETLEVLARIIGHGDGSRLNTRLVMEERSALTSGAMYFGVARDSGRLVLFGLATDPASTEKLERSIDRVIAEVRDKGVTAEEVERAKEGLEARFIYEADNQATLAKKYGEWLTAGRTVADVEAAPERLARVRIEDVNTAARKYLLPERSVTGVLLSKASAEGSRAPAVAGGSK
jgi:zinc protease